MRDTKIQRLLLYDIDPLHLIVTQYFDEPSHLEATLRDIDENYETILMLFHELTTRSLASYPFLSLEALKPLFIEMELLPDEMLQPQKSCMSVD
mmetsp:Transcript_38094/g.58121  ORF Transcript_38094/g.58121 Transcript_38094/m.58121 type:complete len:94 (-) Transcript_38094:361-642(-)